MKARLQSVKTQKPQEDFSLFSPPLVKLKYCTANYSITEVLLKVLSAALLHINNMMSS